MKLPEPLEQRLLRLALRMVDQDAARVIVPPQDPSTGHWFGGGNLLAAADALYLVGRYRNHGDSRTGLARGTRGLELAVFRAESWQHPFEKVQSWSKSDLDVDGLSVLSIEGSALQHDEHGWELFVSTEKSGIGYPEPFESYLKPGAGVWTIERLVGKDLEELKQCHPQTILSSRDPRHLHLKDPNLHHAADGRTQLVFCTHPFNWSSSNTAYAERPAGADEFGEPQFDHFPRGATWDVAMSRVTCVVDVPGFIVDGARVSLVFYDGGEALRPLDPHGTAVPRPRGYSCEELGGVGYIVNDDLSNIRRLSLYLPAFISPHGTGCSRYVQALWTGEGFFTTWQQSQPDLSQPLVGHWLPAAEVATLLS
ncbi:MAG: hypothetical protein KDB14_29220 [Planctomycetales bacterium]|nr:hypothetical protein [Planctomycetales bacterium]